ncbi:hypothetical protein OUZ56_001306 [Daphnia magna]|uniref:Uncharacterized protein n=1 Tax=Daphnia magna TaxID=35525 RepID=A0ABR0A286_9CRUS|nr:hypothetical protein OUZ56_001306 [Daphnia magna]
MEGWNGPLREIVIRSTSFNKNNQTKQNGEWKKKKKIENQNVYLIDIRGKGYQKGDTFSKCGKERKTVAGRMMSWGEPRVIWMNVKRKAMRVQTVLLLPLIPTGWTQRNNHLLDQHLPPRDISHHREPKNFK